MIALLVKVDGEKLTLSKGRQIFCVNVGGKKPEDDIDSGDGFCGKQHCLAHDRSYLASNTAGRARWQDSNARCRVKGCISEQLPAGTNMRVHLLYLH